MTNTQKIILDLLGQSLFGVPFDAEKYGNEIDWDAVYAESLRQTVIPTASVAVPACARQELRYQWIRDCFEFEQRNYEVLRAHTYVSEILKNNHIPFVILKGASSGAYYPHMYMRNYGDVDFLVSPDMLERTKTVLSEAGFKEESSLPYECGMSKDGVSYDVHTQINGIPDGECGDAIRRDMENFIQSAKPFPLFEKEIPVADDYHHGLILLMHTAKHLVGFGAGLRQFCDWATFAGYMGERFPQVFEESLTRAGLWKFAKVMTAACVTYLHMPAYSWIGETDAEMSERFMDDLMRKGNLRHDGNDDMDSVFIEENHKGGVSGGNMFVQMLKNISGKVCYQWPYMEKVKILIPFGMVWMTVRYCYGVLTGSYKKTNLRGTVEKAKKRKALYEELELYQQGEGK